MNKLPKIPKQLIHKYKTSQESLRHDSYLHGPAHMMRVFILQELICEQLESEGVAVDRQATRWASSVHDIGRVDDGPDPEHGRRSVEWMNANVPQDMLPETVDRATYIVHWHVPSDSEAPVMTPELMVMKDADALDRVRLGDLDASYLRTDAARGLVSVAEQLYEQSLTDSHEEPETFDSVLAAAIKLGLVAK